ncbi:MAG: gliding motility-associated C-terminal domain-containing protein, partial [Bacteroidales bacterium]|nr:gliding motility-associated C-terminal domain-containing protein [Bacteroidales bacterium]MBO4544003.1 gliding motility-associated C-terminal domain-containing protein [Bacteroidales bacterium]
RWGQLVFMSEDPTEQWDGTVNGKFVESNTVYSYTLKVRDYTGQEFEYSGHVTVLR